jgi:hypothetical protein
MSAARPLSGDSRMSRDNHVNVQGGNSKIYVSGLDVSVCAKLGPPRFLRYDVCATQQNLNDL